MSIMSTAKISPTSASSTYTGPVRGWIGPKSRLIRSSSVAFSCNCPSEASLVSACITEPDGTVITGSMVLLHLLCFWSADKIKSGLILLSVEHEIKNNEIMIKKQCYSR